MARGATSEADLVLIVELAAHGLKVSPHQLERWRSWGQLPKPVRHGLGRGRGSTSQYPAEATEMAVVLALCGGQGRSRHHATMALFRFGLPVGEAAVRAALDGVIEEDRRRVRTRTQRNEFYVADLATRAARAIKVDYPLLLSTTPVRGATTTQERERARRRKELQRFAAVKVQMRYGTVSSFELEGELSALGDLGAMLADAVRADERAEAVGSAGASAGDSGADRPPAYKGWTLDPSYERICVARDVVTRLARANGALHELARYWDTPREFLGDLTVDPMSTELAMIPGTLADPTRGDVPFASLVLAGATVEIALISYALYTWFIESAIVAAGRGLELMLKHAREHDTWPAQLPTYDQLDTLGRLDFAEHGDPRPDVDPDDLVAVLETFGIKPSPDGAEIAELWSDLWRESATLHSLI